MLCKSVQPILSAKVRNIYPLKLCSIDTRIEDRVLVGTLFRELGVVLCSNIIHTDSRTGTSMDRSFTNNQSIVKMM